MKTNIILLGCLSVMTLLSAGSFADNGDSTVLRHRATVDPVDVGLKLPAGFKAQIVVENLAPPVILL